MLMIRTAIFLMMLFPLVAFGQAGNGLQAVASSIKSGNAKALAQHFDNNVEITILNKEGAYSKSQAELVVKDFFGKNPPKNFKLIHKGSSANNSSYGIGNLITSGGTFRTYILVKKIGSSHLIQELRFEQE